MAVDDDQPTARRDPTTVKGGPTPVKGGIAGFAPTLASVPDAGEPVPLGDGHAPTLAIGEGRPSASPLPPPPSVPLLSAATQPLARARRRTLSHSPVLEGARYTLGPRIGEGGMGEVIVAFDEQIGREVAVKRILAAE